MPRYTVFLGAPPPHESLPTAKYEWETIQYPNKVTDAELESDRLKSPGRLSGQEQEKQESFWTGYAPASLEAASRRISVLYRDVIFKDKDEEEEDGGRLWDAVDVVDQSDALREQTTAYTWDLTTAASIDPIVTDTFLHAAPSRIVGGGVGGETQYETQLTAISSDASSLLLLPAFRFLISSITPLRALRTTRPSYSVPLYILVAVLELDGPDTVRIKRGPDAGKAVDVLKVIVGDDEGVVAKCTAWRDVAETWGALSGLKRGDIVCISHIQSSWDPRSPLTLTASPSLRSSAEICFRTLPRASFAEADARLRPDLALGAGDPAVRRVAALVRWFEVMAGLAR